MLFFYASIIGTSQCKACGLFLVIRAFCYGTRSESITKMRGLKERLIFRSIVMSSDWNPGPFPHALSPPAFRREKRGCWRRCGCAPRVRIEGGGLSTSGLREAHGGACRSVRRGAGDVALAGTRRAVSLDTSSSSFLSRASPPRLSPPLALSPPPPARAPSPAARGFTSVVSTHVSDRQSLLESSSSPAQVLRAPHTSDWGKRSGGGGRRSCGCLWTPLYPLAASALRLTPTGSTRSPGSSVDARNMSSSSSSSSSRRLHLSQAFPAHLDGRVMPNPVRVRYSLYPDMYRCTYTVIFENSQIGCL